MYALNRPSGTKGAPLPARQAQALAAQGLDTALVHSHRLQLVAADWTSERALEQSVGAHIHAALHSEVTHIIHAAWKLDFVIPVQSFEAQIAGVHTLAALAARSGAHLAFISSVARALGADADTETDTPEDQLPLTWAEGGYGRSKAVAEHILARAADAGTGTAILRAGQLAGATATGSGIWNTSEWFPALTKVSQRLNSLPLLAGKADWLPLGTSSSLLLPPPLPPPPDAPLTQVMTLVNDRSGGGYRSRRVTCARRGCAASVERALRRSGRRDACHGRHVGSPACRARHMDARARCAC